jgi:hypothetical protein
VLKLLRRLAEVERILPELIKEWERKEGENMSIKKGGGEDTQGERREGRESSKNS